MHLPPLSGAFWSRAEATGSACEWAEAIAWRGACAAPRPLPHRGAPLAKPTLTYHIYFLQPPCVHRRKQRAAAHGDTGLVGVWLTGAGAVWSAVVRFLVGLCAFVTSVEISVQNCLFSLLSLVVCV